MYLHTTFFPKPPYNVIMARICLPGQRSDFSTRIKLPDNVKWGGDKLLCLGRSKDAIEINDQLTVIRARIKSIWDHYRHLKMTTAVIRDLYLIQGDSDKIPGIEALNIKLQSIPAKKTAAVTFPTTVAKAFEYYIQEKEKDGRSPNTLSFYSNAGKSFLAFLLSEYQVDDLSLKLIDRPLFRAYKQRLDQNEGISPNTAYQYAQALATVVDFIIDEFQEYESDKLPSTNVFSSLIKPPKKDAAKKDKKKIPPGLEEKLWAFSGHKKFTDHVNKNMLFWKHIMLWQWNTGMSFADLGAEQNWKFIEVNGNKFLEYARQKTGVRSYAPMTEKTDNILEFFDSVRLNNRLIPIDKFVDNNGVIIQKEYEKIYESYRVHLKKFSELFGVKMTTHMFRHSFGQNQVDGGQDLYNVSGMMGHGSVKTTEREYTSVSPLRLTKKTG